MKKRVSSELAYRPPVTRARPCKQIPCRAYAGGVGQPLAYDADLLALGADTARTRSRLGVRHRVVGLRHRNWLSVILVLVFRAKFLHPLVQPGTQTLLRGSVGLLL